MMLSGGEWQDLEKYLLKWHFVYNKSHIVSCGNELWHGQYATKKQILPDDFCWANRHQVCIMCYLHALGTDNAHKTIF